MSPVPRAPAANLLLAALPSNDRRRLLAHCKPVDLAFAEVLCEAGERMRHVYFPNNAVISMFTPLDGYPNVEVGLVGREGIAGISLFLGISVSPVRLVVQGSGTAMRMNAASFAQEIAHPALRQQLNRYLHVLMAEVMQTAACNRRHLLEPRLARWLLMTHDRIQSNEIHLTQQFLAHMLGTQRVAVTKAAGTLQRKKLIRYTRGRITILNRRRLEQASCACYRAANDIRDRLPT